ncbi:MAG: TRAP transporter small permease [Bradyrhizobium sp.]|uniref:TRAP transporter small permease n=1 Tax=Bradyrhizobium sp. TaxID=376 RepID=UPI003D10FC5B
MAATLRRICRLVTLLMILLMVTMVVVINSLVVTRYFFSYSPSWTEEVTRFSMIWMVMLGAGVLALFDDHISLTMAVEKLSTRWRNWQRLLVHCFVFAVAVLIAWEGFKFSAGLDGVIAPALQISMLYPSIAVPIGAVLIAAFSAVRIAVGIAVIAGGAPVEVPSQFEFMDNSFKPAEENEGRERLDRNAESQRVG